MKTWLPPMARDTGSGDEDPRGRDQKPETDCWPWRGVRRGPNHLRYQGNRDREARR